MRIDSSKVRALVRASLAGGGIAAVVLIGHDVASRTPRASKPSATLEGSPAPEIVRRYAHLPVRFEENRGQLDARARFVARHAQATLFATDEGMTLVDGSGAVVRMAVEGGRRVTPTGERELVTRSHYLRGNDPARWLTDVRNYGEVIYRGVRDGVDLVLHGEDGQIEYDFVLAPGADPRPVALEIDGAEELSVTASGELAVHTERATLIQPRPRAFQRGADGATIDVNVSYRLVGQRRVGFELAAYDVSRELVIDPVIAYSTHLGGTTERSTVNAVAIGAAGECYVAGRSWAADFPTSANAWQGDLAGSGTSDAVFAKLDVTGTTLLYATYVGGSEYEEVEALAVGPDGSVYGTGTTTSADFPLVSALDSTFGGGEEAFVVKLNPLGSGASFSTYLGGDGVDRARGIALDAAGSAYVVGYTESADFPVVGGARMTLGGLADGFVAKLTPSGASIAYATFVGGSKLDGVNAVAVDSAGRAYVAGSTESNDLPSAVNTFGGAADALVARLNAAGDAFEYARYIGGVAPDGSNVETAGTFAVGVAADADGNAYVAGNTASAALAVAPAGAAIQPSLKGGGDGFVTKIGPTGTTVVYSTYLGGSAGELLTGLALDAKRNVHVTGHTDSSDFPTRNALQPQRKGSNDAFVARINADGTVLVHATFLGGATKGDGDVAERPEGIAVDGRGDVYVVGRTGSSDFPLVNPLLDANAVAPSETGFITKIATPDLVVTPSAAQVAAGASLTFVASQGSGPGYRFSLKLNASGGTIDATTGVYTAGTKPDVVDEVLVVDEAGDEVVASVTVTPAAAPDAGAQAPGSPSTPGSPAEPPSGPDDGPLAGATDAGDCACRAAGDMAPSGRVPVLAAIAASALVVARRRRRG